MSAFSAIVIGDESLLVSCSDLLLARGHRITAVVTGDPGIADWARAKGLTVLAELDDLSAEHAADWLLSIANLRLIKADLLELGRTGAINFHDGPLPAYAGLNAPAWALAQGESHYGVSWHKIEIGIDTGHLLAQQSIDIAPDDTAFSLNAKCYAAGIESFETVLDRIEADDTTGTAQDADGRSYFARDRRPDGAGRLNFAKPAEELHAMVRAMDFGSYWNPLTCAKLQSNGHVLAVLKSDIVDASGDTPGHVQSVTADALEVTCGTGALRLSGLHHLDGSPADPRALFSAGAALSVFDTVSDAALRAAHEAIAPHDLFWRRHLAQAAPAKLFHAKPESRAATWQSYPVTLPGDALSAVALWTAISCGLDQPGDLGYAPASLHSAAQRAPDYLANSAPLPRPAADSTVSDFAKTLAAATDRIARNASFARDICLRAPEITSLPMSDIALADGAEPLPGTVVTVTPETGVLHADLSRIDPAYAELLAARLTHVATWLDSAAPETPLAQCPALAPDEAVAIARWNDTAKAYDTDLTVPAAFRAQATLTPDATAIVFEDQSITYAGLAERCDAIAHALTQAGVARGDHVGLYCGRSIDMVAGALAIMHVGAAYVPLDPAYPADRLAHYITDSGAGVILADGPLPGSVADQTSAQILNLGDITPAPATPTVAAAPDDLAYLIYTSGSTGLPKGVMVSHRNVINFFEGMDADVDRSEGMTWAAVTSLAFDISVLELFYTLARGFKVVLIGDENRAAVSNGPIRLPGKKIDFNLFYWGNDDGVGRDKYALLLEGAKFADAHGFNAVWTPERHFHAFGGPYPNPSVTGAAVAAVTRNLSVRAGSCVAPLHHTARIAEEWAVIDNLTNGRAGLAIASGWQPDDFVLRPENTPPENKPAMYRAIADLRKLWRGETVEFNKADGTPHAVLTQPRPVSPELPVWVTTAGNPETWREAGEIGANVLTHLLGQSIDEVGEKIAIYHAALRDAGHDPDDFTVTLMLHSYLAADRDTARAVARGPMKDYLRSAAGLIKQYAWAFPAFKRPQGVNNPFEMDLGSLEDDELEAILDFAFERYFEESGLFGTMEDALARVDQVRQIGVTEIACLIDYGIPVPQVLDGLKPLAQVLKTANAPAELAADDFSLAAQLVRHSVSHLQCTPSMAQIIAMDDTAARALGVVKQLLLGGEALPGALVRDLRKTTRAQILNMYGPTETTIWSSTQPVTDASVATVPIGAPIANTTLHVLDAANAPAPIGVIGELCIGGDGVTKGYWQRPELTAERFIAHPVTSEPVYRTGDLVCRRADGVIDFLGRNDGQVKIRGQRIELGEIEHVMCDIGFVTQAVVIARKDAQSNESLAGYFVAEGPSDETALRKHLEAHLPAAMVPATLTRLDAFPLTPNRKIDRKALPEPHQRVITPDPVALPADGSVSERISTIWSRILGVGTIQTEDNFFDLGGHSLLAVQAHREIKSALGRTDLSITDIFRFPTLGGLTNHLARGGSDEVTPKAPPPVARGDVISKRKAMRANRSSRVG